MVTWLYGFLDSCLMPHGLWVLKFGAWDLGLEIWYLILMAYGSWLMAHGFWVLKFGAWDLGLGTWGLGLGA